MSATIRQVLEVLSKPGQVIERRIPRVRHTRSGYFDDWTGPPRLQPSSTAPAGARYHAPRAPFFVGCTLVASPCTL